MNEEKRFAVLIDADNVSVKYIKYIFEEMSNYGLVTYKRIYGDWTRVQSGNWKEALLENSVNPIQQYAYTTGKNATDSAMIIDAMDILYSENVEGFCIVSSDSDFTRLASRLRESGMEVIGMGEKKTPKPFTTACNIFKYLDVLYESESQEQQTMDKAAMKELEESLIRIITEYGEDNKGINIGELGSRLVKRHPDFDVRNFGYTKLSRFLERFESFVLNRTENSINVGLRNQNNEEDKIQQIIINCVRDSKTDEVNLGHLNKELNEIIPNFDVRTYGYTKFLNFVKDIYALNVISSGKNGCVKTVKLRKK